MGPKLDTRETHEIPPPIRLFLCRLAGNSFWFAFLSREAQINAPPSLAWSSTASLCEKLTGKANWPSRTCSFPEDMNSDISIKNLVDPASLPPAAFDNAAQIIE